jgi:hypothetical protein
VSRSTNCSSNRWKVLRLAFRHSERENRIKENISRVATKYARHFYCKLLPEKTSRESQKIWSYRNDHVCYRDRSGFGQVVRLFIFIIDYKYQVVE